ncbi:Isopentenyl-diphosphate delta-isomerase [Halomonadaceae bacterium LMG 33818]|uniref:type 2 isopentenyl-diphosphate Delta-isomerase n=1 Tax=Cernens ardua TaxID=3402176 RepID=UPI003EDC49A2
MSHSQRKDDHVAHAEALYQERRINDFDHIDFVHHSLPNVNSDHVSLITQLGDIEWPLPFYINGMTGGSLNTGKINQALGEVARATGVAIATGSQSAALKKPELAPTFSILREQNPDGFIMGNVGAGTAPDAARKAVEMLQADALQVHINAPQELVMPEGDRDFTHWLDNIAEIKRHVSVPVIAKEVGFGMSEATIQALQARGISLIDVSGRGGTNFIAIENQRREARELGYLEGWGQSAVASLLEASLVAGTSAYTPSGETILLASGGVRTPLDVVKALALGAKAVGVSGFVLHELLTHGTESVIATLEDWKKQIRLLMTMVGAASIDALKQTDLLIRGPLKEYCELRGISPLEFAQRRKQRT